MMHQRKKRLKILTGILTLFFGCYGIAQNKYEREYRIKKSQFPEKALNHITEKLEGAKRIKFYKETDSSKTSFETKFKKDKLWYSVEFDKEGNLEDIEIIIKEIDIPSDSFMSITTYLQDNFLKYRIRKIQQQYPFTEEEQTDKTIKNAFQNLMLPSINYEIIVSGKKEEGYGQYEILFDANGAFIQSRKSLPPNYDHVLY